MLHLATDASFDEPICSCGWVLTRSAGGSEELVETGSRVLNTDGDRRDIDWCASRAEYRALITGVRAALDYTDEAVLCYTDNEPVKEAIRNEHEDPYESYFRHAFMSFVERFSDWHISSINRDRNEVAHDQARTGLKVGRELLDPSELQAP